MLQNYCYIFSNITKHLNIEWYYFFSQILFLWTNKNVWFEWMKMIRFFFSYIFRWDHEKGMTKDRWTSWCRDAVNRDKIQKFADRMQWIMSQSRRSSISIHDYPEHLNPFNDDITSTQSYFYHDGKAKDSKHKFWTFGRSRKKRSNSFSIKSTWWILF